MQSMAIPVHTLQVLERIGRNFFWSSTPEKRAMHTVAWQKICCPIAAGGLGVPILRENNVVLLAKQIWKLVQQLDSLGSQILMEKYGG